MTITRAIRQQRKGGLGGSDAAAILGISPNGTPLSVYDSKLLELPDEPKDIYWYGNEGEKMIAARIWHDLRARKEYRGRRLIEPKEMLWHPNGWAFGNPDRILIEKSSGKWLAGYECKWVNNNDRARWSEADAPTVNYPKHFWAQAFHYLWVARARGHNLDCWWIVAMLGGYDTRYYRVGWDEERAAKYEKRLRRFWEDHVLAEIPPPYTARKTDTRSLNRRFQNEIDEALQSTPEIDKKMDHYAQITKTIRSLEEERGLIKNDLRAWLGSSTRVRGDSWSGSYRKPRTKMKIDYKALVESLELSPGELSKFTKKTEPDRRLTITIKKEKKND